MRHPDRTEALLVSAIVVSVTVGFIVNSWPVTYARVRARHDVDSRCTSQLTRATIDHVNRHLALAASQADVKAIADGPLFRWDTALGTIWTAENDRVSAIMAETYFLPMRWDTIDARPDIVPIAAGDVVMDAGAHIGESTRRALVLGASRVIAIEPMAGNLQALRRNLAAEIAAGKVTLIEKGVYDREGMLSFVTHDSWSGSFEEHDEDGTGQQLPVTTIDAIVTALGLTRLDFIKMDIEGSEPYALRGAQQTLRRFKPRIAVGTYHRPGDLEAVERIVLETVPDYEVIPSRCMVKNDKLFPHLLYFR